MPLLRRHKYILASLAVYWPALFILTHIPIPNIARESGMSDKTMHYLAYMGLMFLVWLAVNPYEKVNWKKAKVWVILAVVVWYGAIDEWLQGLVGREANVMDFAADLIGALIALGLLTIFSFWPASLILCATYVFVITNMSRIDELFRMPYLNTSFHFIGYGCFTLLWIQFSGRYVFKSSARRTTGWFITAISLPVLLLIIVKVYSAFISKKVWSIDCAIALGGILLAVITSWMVFRFRKAEV